MNTQPIQQSSYTATPPWRVNSFAEFLAGLYQGTEIAPSTEKSAPFIDGIKMPQRAQTESAVTGHIAATPRTLLEKGIQAGADARLIFVQRQPPSAYRSIVQFAPTTRSIQQSEPTSTKAHLEAQNLETTTRWQPQWQKNAASVVRDATGSALLLRDATLTPQALLAMLPELQKILRTAGIEITRLVLNGQPLTSHKFWSENHGN